MLKHKSWREGKKKWILLFLTQKTFKWLLAKLLHYVLSDSVSALCAIHNTTVSVFLRWVEDEFFLFPLFWNKSNYAQDPSPLHKQATDEFGARLNIRRAPLTKIGEEVLPTKRDERMLYVGSGWADVSRCRSVRCRLFPQLSSSQWGNPDNSPVSALWTWRLWRKKGFFLCLHFGENDRSWFNSTRLKITLRLFVSGRLFVEQYLWSGDNAMIMSLKLLGKKKIFLRLFTTGIEILRFLSLRNSSNFEIQIVNNFHKRSNR